MPSSDVRRNLQPNGLNESFWDAVGLGIQTFLCFMLSTPDFDRGRLFSPSGFAAAETILWDALGLGIRKHLC